MDKQDHDDDRRVCHVCVGEAVLTAEILRGGRPATCDFCGNEDEPSVTIAALARRVDDTFQSVVRIAPEEFRMTGGRPDFGPNGDTPSALMAEMIEAADDEIGREIVEHLSGLYQWDVHDGGFDWYDDSSDIYAIETSGDGRLKERWVRFSAQLKQERRFFLEEGIEVLDEILSPLLDGRWPDGGAIRTIGPDDDRFIYRGRVANDDGASASILRQRISQLGAARPGQAGAGRMNPAGVSVFYGAFDPVTCVAELRVPVGGAAIVGRFEILRPLRLLDLTRLDSAQRQLSYFEPGYAELRGYADFLRGFHEEIRRAVIPGRETLDYLPTQIVAEYLWAKADPPFDGLIFGSSQISETQNNIVLFPHAATLEGAEAEPERKISFAYTSGDEDGEELKEQVFFEPLPPAVADKPPARELPDDWFAWHGGVDEIGPPQPALRLAEDGVARYRVRGIVYDTEPAIPIAFADDEEREF